MPLNLKNDFDDPKIATNFVEIKNFCNSMEGDMTNIDKKLEVNSEALVRIENKIDESVKADASKKGSPGSITVSTMEYRIFTFLLFFGLFGWETISKSKFLQGILGKLF